MQMSLHHGLKMVSNSNFIKRVTGCGNLHLKRKHLYCGDYIFMSKFHEKLRISAGYAKIGLKEI